MRVVVVGATGNCGSSLVRLLAAEPRIDSVLGLARRRPRLELPKTEWAAADVAKDDLGPLFRSADAVVHLAWLIQPSRDEATLRRVNVDGSARVFQAVERAEVPALVYASSVGAYSPGPKDRRVDESWPVGGVETSFYARHKAEVERRLDDLESAVPELRVARLRPGLIFKRTAATGIRRLFAGPFVPGWALRPGLVPFVPDVPGLCFQAVHADDVAKAYLEAIARDVRGAFNVAAEPPLDAAALGRLLRARPIRVGRPVAHAAVSASWRLRLQPTPPGWLDMGLAVPLMDCGRARAELGWEPRRSAEQALGELLDGLRSGAGDETPPLAPRTGGPLRLRELATGVGGRDG
jgi:nucleoside-diphosphate-sugar epimerase